MLGTKDPLAFQAVYGVTNPADDTVDYVSPDDESEARRIRDLTRSGEHAIEQDDEFASNGDIYPQWESFDNPSYVARSIATGT